MLYFANKYFIFIYFGISFAFAANISKAKVDLWKKLKEPKYVLAPMVDYSELAWRLLCRRHGAQLCYTPMLNSIDFVKNPEHRKKNFITCSEDRPLIVQLSANDPETLLKAALLVQDHCDCIDINLGSPLPSAKKGNFGAYLQEDWKLVSEMVKMLSKNLRVPVSCKIRIFPEISKTVTYSQMLENSGCQLITVHGRTLEQVGPKTGLASWAHIKAVRQAVNIPVIANGNIRCLEDVNRCLRETGCHGVMSAEGLLHNPALFEGSNCTVWEAALEYLDLVKLYTSPLSIVRNHLLKLFLHLFAISENANVQSEIIAAQDIYRLENIVKKIEAFYKPIQEGHQTWNHKSLNNSCFPPWICQPRIRKEFKNDEIVQKNHDNKDKQVKSQKSLGNLQYNCSNCSAV